MAGQVANNLITISKNTIQKVGGMVILPLKEYEKLCERAMSSYQLKGKEAKELDELVEEGLKDYKAGKCKKIKSLAELD